MWGWIIKVTLISLLLIFLLHYLYSFFKTTLTSPKLKDLVNKPQAKYNTIYNSLKSAGDGGSLNLGKDSNDISNTIDNSKTSNMKNELKKYLKELNINNNDNNTSKMNIINPHNEETNVYSINNNNNIISNVGANGISTRVNNNSNYVPTINKVDTQSNIDYGTPSTSSSYSSPYSPY